MLWTTNYVELEPRHSLTIQPHSSLLLPLYRLIVTIHGRHYSAYRLLSPMQTSASILWDFITSYKLSLIRPSMLQSRWILLVIQVNNHKCKVLTRHQRQISIMTQHPWWLLTWICPPSAGYHPIHALSTLLSLSQILKVSKINPACSVTHLMV